MANYKSGSFAVSSSVGAQSITGLGFKPKFVLFSSTRVIVEGIAAELSLSMGAADGTSEWLVHVNAEDNQATTDCRSVSRTDRCVFAAIPGTDTAIYSANFTTMDEDGFTLDVTDAGSGELVYYLALGGDNIEAEVFADALPGSTGDHSVTGLTFEPEGLLLMGINNAAVQTTQNTLELWMGFSTNDIEQGCSSISSQSSVGTSNSQRAQNTDKVIRSINNIGVEQTVATFEEFTSDGYTINLTTSVNADFVFGVAFKGVEMKVGSFVTPDATGEFFVEGIGFMPQAAIFTSWAFTPLTTVIDNIINSYGFTDGEFQSMVAATDEDGVGTTVTWNGAASDLIFQGISLLGAAEFEVAFNNFRTDGFALDEILAGTNEVLFLAFEDLDNDDPPEDIIKIRSFPGALPLSSSIVNKYDPPIQKTIQDLAITKGRVAKLETANPQFAVTGDSDLIEIAISVAQQEIGSNSLLRISTSANRNISGFITPSRGRLLTVVNVGSTNNLVLVHEGVLAAAPNRILTHSGADITLGPGEAADLYYDDLVPRWRLLFSS